MTATTDPAATAWVMMTAPDDPMPPYAALDWLRTELGTDDVPGLVTLLTRELANRWEGWYKDQHPETRGMWDVTFPVVVRIVRSGDATKERVRLGVNAITTQSKYMAVNSWSEAVWLAWVVTATRDLALLTDLRTLTGG